jgi:hypothetical protein
MTQTLTTEQLQEIYEAAVHVEDTLNDPDAEFELYSKLDEIGGVESTIRKLIDMMRAANREAQPVAYLKKSIIDSERFDSADPEIILHPNTPEGWHSEYQAVFTAPPAPVVNPELTGATAVPDGYCIMPLTLTAANGAKGALSGEFKVSRTVRCHECGGEGCDDCADAGEFEEEITVPWDTIKDIYRAAVDTCRAAMLAAPEGGNG